MVDKEMRLQDDANILPSAGQSSVVSNMHKDMAKHSAHTIVSWHWTMTDYP